MLTVQEMAALNEPIKNIDNDDLLDFYFAGCWIINDDYITDNGITGINIRTYFDEEAQKVVREYFNRKVCSIMRKIHDHDMHRIQEYEKGFEKSQKLLDEYRLKVEGV